jgi:hypothetical protein
MAKQKSFNYKELAMDFNWYKVPGCDQEYLRTMMMETVTNNSVNATGVSFKETYPRASNFALFQSEDNRDNYLAEFALDGAGTASHLLTDGRKYFVAWTYEG